MTMMSLSKHRMFHVLLLITFIVGLCTPAAPNAANATPVVPLPRVSPPPQSMESNGASITLPKQAKLVYGMGADLTAVALVRETLENHGILINDKAGNLEIYVGGPEETPESEGILAKLGREGPEALPDDGYVLAIERSQGIKIVLSGKDATGTYYAALTMSQLIQRQGESVRLPAVYIRDYPNFPFRGGEESFYGPQWSWEDRYDQVDFLSEHKMNYFFYGPAEDDRTTGRAWRDLYPPEELEKFRRLVEYARAKHVKFLYRIGPESPQIGGSALGICHARTGDRDALIQRLEQMYSIGVRTFVISWDDVTETFTCEEDAQRYGSGPIALATAQAEVLNDIQERFFDVFPDVERGITIPSQYWLNEPTPYRSTFDELVTESMDFYWTGPHVTSLEIEEPDVIAAQQAFPRHNLLVFDNYPVNDYNRNRLLLGPLDRRAASLSHYLAGISWNEMNEQKASQIALFTEAEYAWNPAAYSPERAWEAALQEIGGKAYEALKVFADANRSGRFLGDLQAPTLAGLTQAVREAYEAGADLSAPAGALKDYVQKMSNAPDELRRELPSLADETAPWLDKLERSAVAVNDALDLLQALADRDEPSADAALERLEQSLEALRANPKEIAAGVVDPFVAFASEEYHKLKQRYLALALPYGMRAFPVGVATEAEVILYASSPDEVRGTLKVEVPGGWIVKEAVQQIALPGNGRTSAYTYRADVTVPAGVLPGYIHFRFEEDEGRVVTASMYVQPANMTNEGYRELVLADAPNAFWRLDDLSNTLVDISGNDLHGIYRSEVERGVPGATNDGNAAVRFAGGYAEVPSTSEVSPVGPFTIEAWIRPEVVAGGDGQGIVEKYSAPARNGYLIRLDGGNRLMAFTMSSTDASYVVGGPSIGLGEWHHVAAVFDGVSLVIYLDGIEVGRNEKAIMPEAGPISLKIGARGDDRVRRFTGGIDDVAYYSKALSAAEIAEHFLVGVR